MQARTVFQDSRAGDSARRAAAVAAMAAMLCVGPALASESLPAAAKTALAAEGLPASRANGMEVSPYVRNLALLINGYRSSHGLAPLELAAELNELASEHSSQMAGQQRLSHNGFRDRFDRARARVCVENVGMNFPHGEAQLDGWRASPGHHRNLLEPKVARMGIAKHASFVTFFACS